MPAWNHKWLYISQDDLKIEWQQCQEEGKDVSVLEAEFARVRALDLENLANQPAAQILLDKTAALPIRPDHGYVEPSDLDGIRAQRKGDFAGSLDRRNPRGLCWRTSCTARGWGGSAAACSASRSRAGGARACGAT